MKGQLVQSARWNILLLQALGWYHWFKWPNWFYNTSKKHCALIWFVHPLGKTWTSRACSRIKVPSDEYWVLLLLLNTVWRILLFTKIYVNFVNMQFTSNVLSQCVDCWISTLPSLQIKLTTVLSLVFSATGGGGGGGVGSEKVAALEQKLFKLQEEVTELHRQKGEVGQPVD